MGDAWLNFTNPVDISTDTDAVQGSIVGGANAVLTNDGDTSYVEVSNGTEVDGRDGGHSRTFRVSLVPDGTLPPASDLASFNYEWVVTGRVLGALDGVSVARLTGSGSETIGSLPGSASTYTEDIPRGSTTDGPTWDQLRTDGWDMPFRGRARDLIHFEPEYFGYLRITRIQLHVTWALVETGTVGAVVVEDTATAPPLRHFQRGDRKAVGGVPRLSQNRTRAGSLRRGPNGIV